MKNNLILTSSISDIHFQLGSTDVKTIGLDDQLIYYEVSVQFDNSGCSVEGVLLSFNYSDGDSAFILSEYLNSVSSSYVMNAYGCMEGENERSHQSFLALPFFDKTFASFIEKESDITADNGRFTDQFIEVMSGVVKGFLTLHENGYYCPAFKGQHVAIITQDGHQQAKIWNFCVAGSELAKNEDWVRLADKIQQAAENHKIYSTEIADLCEKMRNGKLKGLKILKHSALLSVSKKSDQLLALCNYAWTYSDTSRQHPYINDPVKSNLHDDLFLYLNKAFNWGQSLPGWMRTVRTARMKTLPLTWNGGSFLYEQRSMIQHENAYIPPLPPQEFINSSSKNSATDLEEACRTSWGDDVLKLHNFALELGLEYE